MTNSPDGILFNLNTVGAMKDELKSLFLVQQSNQTVFSSCNNPIVRNTNVFVLYITSLSLDETQFESDICRAIYQIAILFSAMFVGVILETYNCCNILLHFLCFYL